MPAADARPLVSIAIRAYRGQWLEEAIGSALSQTFRDLELIVYDDAGDLESVVARVSDTRLRYHRATERFQASGRFLAAAALCRGTFFGLLDDDDRYAPEFVERLLTALQEDPHAGVAFCRTTWDWNGRLVRPLDPRPPGAQDRAAEAMLTDGWTISPSHMLIRRAAFDAALAHQAMPDGVSPDVFLNLQIALAGWRHLLVDAPLTVCRWHDTQLSRSRGWSDTAIATWQTLNLPDPTLTALRDHRLARALLVRAFERITAGDTAGASQDLQTAASTSPSSWRGARRGMRVAASTGIGGRLLLRAWSAWSPQSRQRRRPPQAIGDRLWAQTLRSPRVDG